MLVPLYTGDAADPSGDERLRIAHVNMQGNDVDDEELQDALVEHEPDVLVLLEPAPGWEPPPGTGYRHLAPTAQPRVHLLTATEVSNVRVPQGEEMPPASLAFEVALGDRTQPVGVLAVHAYAPSTPDQRDVRDGQLDAVGDWAVLQRGPELVLGDLNAVPWSDAMESLEDRDDLRSSVDGFGLQATWPALLGPLGIPIDQLLHSPDLTVTDRETGPSLGSAHRSLWVTVAPAASS